MSNRKLFKVRCLTTMSSMNMNNYVQHPTLSREKLNLKRLAIIHADEAIKGYLKIGDERHDKCYVLMFHPDPNPSWSVPAKTATGVSPRFHLLSGVQSLDQSTVDRIRIREANDPAEDCYFVCVMPFLPDA